MSKLTPLHCFLALSFLVAACGATDTDGDNGAGADGGACVATAETETNCSDGVDNNCDGKLDCENLECAFDSYCDGSATDGCGKATFSGDPLAIPDGVGMSYETIVTINGFEDGQTLRSADGFVSACVSMEHSWLRDLQIEMICPSGQLVILNKFLGQEGGKVVMGTPTESDGSSPTPGVGAEYCWTASAANGPMLEWASANATVTPGLFGDEISPIILPAGEYRPYAPFDALIDCTLNGDWSIRATDDWRLDNGFIFEWRVTFNQNIIADCTDWID